MCDVWECMPDFGSETSAGGTEECIRQNLLRFDRFSQRLRVHILRDVGTRRNEEEGNC